MVDPPVVQIFISSPNRDVGSEREVAERVIARLDGIWKMRVRLHAKRWEKSEYQAIKGFQQAIGEMAVYDVVIGILWKCIGSPLPPDLFRRPNGSAYQSGTVFEIESAIAAGEKGGKPAVYILRKSADVKFDARTVDEEKDQYARLLDWWDRTFDDEHGHNRRGYQWFKTTEEFEARLERLIENHLLERGLIPAGPAWDLDKKGSPYPGLISYAIEYAPVYCGRALTVRSAIEELKHAAEQEMPALFVVGPSGSGKSSLANAGLAPQFVGRGIEGVDFWRHVLIEPADDLIPLIARKLYEALPEIAAGPDGDVNGLCASLQESPATAARTVKWALDRAGESLRDKTGGGAKQVGRLLLVLDQLETILKSPHRGKVSALARALIANEAAWVITTLRSDRYADLQQNEDFMAMRQRGALLDLPLPGPSEIDDIIKGPARAAQLIFEEREGTSLAHVLRAAAGGPDALPLLQMTLTRLYEAREGRVLTFAAYKSMGGLEGAIAAYADEVFASLSGAAQEKLDGLLRVLVADIDDDGRLTICTPLRSAIANDPASAELVETMTEARLLVSAGDSVRVAHEALLRRWQRAVDSPALQGDAIRLRRQLQPACDLWTRTRLESDLLQAGTALAAAERVTQEHPGAFPPQLDTYIARSAAKANERAAAEKLKAQAEARRAKLRASIAFVMVAVLTAVSVAAFRLYETANANLVLALLAKADQLMIDERPTQADFLAEAIPRDLLSRVLAIGGASHQSEAEIRTRTIAAIAGPAATAALSTFMARSGATALAVSRDGNSFAAGFASGDIVVGSTTGEGSLRHLTGHSATINALAFSPTDATLVSASTDHSVRVWRTAAESPQVVCLASLVNALDIDSAGNVALALEDGEVEIFNIATPAEHRLFSQDHRAAYGVAFSPDGSLLASSGKDDTIFIRHLADGDLANKIATGHSDINSVSFSPDGKRIVAASVSGPVDVWDVFAPAHGTLPYSYKSAPGLGPGAAGCNGRSSPA